MNKIQKEKRIRKLIESAHDNIDFDLLLENGLTEEELDEYNELVEE
jgi:hypothetical protein